MNTEIADMNKKITEMAMTTLAAMSEVPEKFSATEIKNFYENILAKLPCLIVWKDKDFKYVFCNEVTTADFLKSSSPSEIIGKTDFDLTFNFEAAKSLRQVDEEIVKTGKPALNIATTFEMNDGRIVHLSTNRMPLFDRAGEVIGILGVGVDITAQKAAERREKEHQQVILQEKENFAQLARKVAHDINSPLAALNMMLEMCNELPEDKRTFFRRATESILDIANNLLTNNDKEDNSDYVGIEFRESLLVSDLLTHLLSEKKVQYQDYPVTFETIIESDAQFAFIQMQKIEFRRAMSNLINNAVDALEDRENGVVTVQLTANANSVIVDVKDNGKGMPLAMIEKIQNYQSFTEGKENGHGIGLQQVWDMLEFNQGTMEVQSLVGKGSSIQLTFPRKAASNWIAQEIHLIPGNIIVILDDDESIHTAWSLRFAPLIEAYPALRLHHFTHGKEALNFLATLSPEQKSNVVFLSDYELLYQDKNGLEIIEISQIKDAMLVTSYYSNSKIRDAASRLNVKILPKQMASVIPVNVNA